MSKKIVICGNYGASNIGDEALLEGIISFVRAAFPVAQITVMSADPAKTSQRHHVQSVAFVPCGVRSFVASLKDGFSKTLQALKESDLFIMGGGGLFTDEKFRAIFIWSIQGFFASWYHRPIVCIGQSVGPLRTGLGRFFTRRFFKKCRAITVRDSISAKVLEGLGFSQVDVLADPAFTLPVKTLDALKREPFIVLSVRPWLSSESQNQTHILAQFIDWVFEKYGFVSKLVPFQTFQDNDVTGLNEIFHSLKNPESAQMLSFTEDYHEILDSISHARGVVGMRLHSLIFSILTETPFLALSYSQKIDGVVNDVEMGEFLIHWKHLSLQELQDKFDRLMEKQSSIQQKLTSHRKRFALLAQKNVDVLQKTFSGL